MKTMFDCLLAKKTVYDFDEIIFNFDDEHLDFRAAFCTST
jgi:hypothetical protein